MEELRREFKCQDSMCVIAKSNIKDSDKARIKRKWFKATTDSFKGTYWLNNTEIDTVMSHLRLRFPGFAHGFIHMSDFVAYLPENHSTYAYAVHAASDIDFPSEFRKSMIDQGLIQADANEPKFVSKLSTYKNHPLRSYGIVCNTDTSSGTGRHWFALFISTDLRDPSNPKQPMITIELFNSAGGASGNKSFDNIWRTKAVEMSKRIGIRCEYKVVTTIQHQEPDTGNCGSYSLFYMYARMNGAKPSEFDNPQKQLQDHDMEKFRRVCFRIKDGQK
jgi:hypothetical protein